MMIDIKRIEALLASDISGDRVEAATGIGKKTISNYRTGNAKIENMTLETADKLCRFWDQAKNEKPVDIKLTGIRNAVGTFNAWQGPARVYFDKSDMSIWTNTYAGPGEWDEYDDSHIVEVYSKATNSILERDDRTTMRQLTELCAAELFEP